MPRSLDALVPYYGSKRQMAARVVEELGPHRAYWEPFCGSLAVLLAKPPCPTEVVNDLHGDVVNLARVVQHDLLGPLLFERLGRTLFAEGLYADALAELGASPAASDPDPEPGPDLRRAHLYFVACWMGRNGFAGTALEGKAAFCARYTSNGGDPAVRFRNVVERIPAWWQRLRGVTVRSADGLALLRQLEDKAGTVVYADPPYLAKGQAYLRDFAPGDHWELACLLGRFARTRVVLSYYDHPELARLYPEGRWEKKRVNVPKNLSVASGAAEAPEVLLVNRTE
jgi:DNA adenine methylase